MKNIKQSLLLTVLVVCNASAEPQLLTKVRNGLHGCAATNLPVVGGYLQKANDAVYAAAQKVAPDNELVQGVAKAAVGAHMPVSVNTLNLAHAVNAFVFNKDGVSYLFPTGKTVANHVRKTVGRLVKASAEQPRRKLGNESLGIVVQSWKSLIDLDEDVIHQLYQALPFAQHAFAIAFLNGEVSVDSVLQYAQSQANESGAQLLFDRYFRDASRKAYWSGFAAGGISSGLTTIAENKDASIKNRFWARATMMALQAASLTELSKRGIKLYEELSFKNLFGVAALLKNGYELRNLYKEYKQQQAERAQVVA